MSLFPELEYTFKHALTHDVAYGSLLQERRKALHAQIVDAIEARYPDRLDEHVERLAHHALRGERWEQAVSYCRQAGQKAVARSANREAVAHFDPALGGLRHLPGGSDSLAYTIDLQLDLRQALMPLAELDRILDLLREAQAQAEALGDRYRIGRVATLLANSFWWLSDHDRGVEAGQRGLAAAEALEDVALQIEARQVLCHVLSSRGDFRQAVDGLS